jgi:hemolysin activation/secretion protein
MRVFSLLCGALLPTLITLTAAAQTPSSANFGDQQLLRQQERESQSQQLLQSKPDVRLQPSAEAPIPRLPADEAPCFVIQRVVLTGAMSDRFTDLMDAANRAADGSDDAIVGRCIGSTGIAIAIRRLQSELVRRGYVTTRVLAAPQDLTTGVLTVTLIPGRVRTIRFAQGSSPRATMWNAMPLQPGDLLNLRALEQALENFKRVPSAEAAIRIEPASGEDTQAADSDVLIDWTQSLPIRLNLALDDAGIRSTGRQQAAFTLSLDHWWTLNDLLYVSVSEALVGDRVARGNRSNTLHYSLPFREWLVALTHSDGEYRQTISGLNGPIVYSGSHSNDAVTISRVLYRDGLRKTTGSLRLWTRESRNFIDDAEQVQQHRRTAGWEVSLAHREQIGASSLDATLSWRRGTGAAGSLRAPEESYGEGSSRMQILRVDALLSHPFRLASHALRYSAGLRAQWHGTPLTPQDRFAIGSRYTVRGFDGESLLIGDSGWLLRQDLGWSLSAVNSELYVGIDTGRVGGRSAELLTGRQLTGAVMGIRGGVAGFGWDVFIGRPLQKPDGFQTASVTTGFFLSASF